MQHAQQTTSTNQADAQYHPLNHGIHAETQTMFDETAADLAELAAELHGQYSPADATERFLVDTLISNEWRLRRLRAVETDLWQTGVDSYLNTNAEMERATSGDAFATTAPAFERLQRIVNSCERNYHRALKQLVALRPARVHGGPTPTQPQPPKPAPQPQHSTTSSAKLAPLSHNPPNPAPAAAQPQPNPLQTRREHHFPTVDEAIDAALRAISKEDSTDR
jgi:hypothetical protein